ncbi:MAG: two-component system, sensor histidine kinase ChiS [Clostridiales bacterium]|nr:two-component system, sensor histidine kinase ChiS [Clostridiales bacterium]
MKVLQGQITPHFLYNTLNTIIGLSYSDENQMREALQALATYFRGKLNFEKSDEMISIEQEIELIRAYLSIEKIRFGDELNIVYDIDETVHFKLPSLTLQPLVENAIRHGILKKEGQGTIKITIKRTENGQALAIIEDDGVGMTEEKRQELLNYTLASNHIGFSNVYRKTALLNRATLALESQPDMGTRVLITFMEDEHVTGDFDR